MYIDKIDLKSIPFSKRGNYIKVCAYSDKLQITTTSHKAHAKVETSIYYQDFYKIYVLKNGEQVEYTWEVNDVEIRLFSATEIIGRISMYYNDGVAFSMEKGFDLELIPFHLICTYQLKPWGEYLVHDYPGNIYHQVRSSGEIITQMGKCVNEETAFNDIALSFKFINDKYENVNIVRFNIEEQIWENELETYQQINDAVKVELSDWMSKMPPVDDKYLEAAKMAWYINWQCIVSPRGCLTRNTMYMSKNWMNQVWAWDNCFNALATIDAEEKLAWEQLMVYYDNQQENGMFPDSINDLEAKFGYMKPPIYGWTIMKLLEKTSPENKKKYLKKSYKAISKLTNWWFTFRDYDKDGVCQYHHGNDSGWDNSTIFKDGGPVEAADLSAHLVVQTDALSKMATMLYELNGKQKHKEASVYWENKSNEQLHLLLTELVQDGKFVSTFNGGEVIESVSLLNYISLVVGKRLPESIVKNAVKDLSFGNGYLTEFGLATEKIDSPYYESDGYWRGPIWAPSTYLIFDGLLDAGETELAHEIAERFCNMCTRNLYMYENYDAITGDGLRCPGYTWTGSVFILIANWLYNYDK